MWAWPLDTCKTARKLIHTYVSNHPFVAHFIYSFQLLLLSWSPRERPRAQLESQRTAVVLLLIRSLYYALASPRARISEWCTFRVWPLLPMHSAFSTVAHNFECDFLWRAAHRRRTKKKQRPFKHTRHTKDVGEKARTTFGTFARRLIIHSLCLFW